MTSKKREMFAEVDARGRSGDDAARAAMRSRSGRPTSLRLGELQPNPDNPRYPDDPETVELAETMQSVGQLQPALVMARADFLACLPHAELGPQPWVVVIGNRRLAAAQLVGRPALDVRVADDIQTVDDLEDRILIENIQRKDLPPLLEAERLQRRLDRGDTFRSLGQKIGKSHTYVKQRVDLLRLIPELQELLREGTLRVKGARWLGAQPEDTQRRIFASGGPYEEPDRAAASTSDPVNRVSNPEDSDDGGDRPAPNTVHDGDTAAADGDPLEPGLRTSTDPGANRGSRSASGPDVVPPREVPDGGVDQGPTLGGDPLLRTRTSVTQWLDNALGDLDGVLPAGGDGGLGSALSRARQLIQDARDAIHQA